MILSKNHHQPRLYSLTVNNHGLEHHSCHLTSLYSFIFLCINFSRQRFPGRFHSASALIGHGASASSASSASSLARSEMEIRIHPAIMGKSQSEECLGSVATSGGGGGGGGSPFSRSRGGRQKRVSAPIASQENTEDSTLDEVSE